MTEKISNVHSLPKDEQRKVTRNSLSTVRPEMHGTIRVWTYPVITAAEIDMFIDLIEVSYGAWAISRYERTKWYTIEIMARTTTASANGVRVMSLPY